MELSRQHVLNAALTLPDAERALLAQEILESLNPDAEGQFDEAWCEELNRRLAEFRSGSADAMPWSVVREME